MSYKLAPDEALQGSFRRCGVEQLDRAVQELTDGVKVDPAPAVHAARKALKKERSLLRLAGSAIKPAERRRQNERLRGAGRRLSATRDDDVMLSALGDLADRYAGQVPATTVDAVRARLESQRDMSRNGLAASGVIDDVVNDLRLAREQAEALRLRANGWSVIGPGVRRSYGRGRKAMHRAQRRPSDENMHEWRKRVKDLWYHLRLLKGTAPRTLSGQIREAHKLADLLGDYHDLAVLDATLRELAPEVATDLGPLVALLDHRRRALRAQAEFAGARLYAETPKAFADRLRSYWKIARAQASAAASHRPEHVAETARQAQVL